MPARHPNLFLDQIEIIEQPLRRRRDAAGGFDAESFFIVRTQQFLIRGQARQEAVVASARAGLMAFRQKAGVALEQFDAEQLPSKRLFLCDQRRVGRSTPGKLPPSAVPAPWPARILHCTFHIQKHSMQPVELRFHNSLPANAIPERKQPALPVSPIQVSNVPDFLWWR